MSPEQSAAVERCSDELADVMGVAFVHRGDLKAVLAALDEAQQDAARLREQLEKGAAELIRVTELGRAHIRRAARYEQRAEQWATAFTEARDAVLNNRGPLEGEGMDGDRKNAVLAVLDDAFDAARASAGGAA